MAEGLWSPCVPHAVRSRRPILRRRSTAAPPIPSHATPCHPCHSCPSRNLVLPACLHPVRSLAGPRRCSRKDLLRTCQYSARPVHNLFDSPDSRRAASSLRWVRFFKSRVRCFKSWVRFCRSWVRFFKSHPLGRIRPCTPATAFLFDSGRNHPSSSRPPSPAIPKWNMASFFRFLHLSPSPPHRLSCTQASLSVI